MIFVESVALIVIKVIARYEKKIIKAGEDFCLAYTVDTTLQMLGGRFIKQKMQTKALYGSRNVQGTSFKERWRDQNKK